MNGVSHDLKLAIRSLRRSPLFAAAGLLTVAIGIGANKAAYSVLHGVLFTPLTLREAHRVVTIWGYDQDFGRVPLPAPDFRAIREESVLVSQLAARWLNAQSLRVGADAEEVMTARVTPNYFSMLGIQPHVGRVLADGDQNVAVLSFGLWARLFGGSVDIVGRTIEVGGNSVEVVGVLPPDMNPNLATVSRTREQNDVWLVMPESWIGGDDYVTGWIRTVGRLAPHASIGQAQEELDAISRRIGETVPARADGGLRFVLQAAREDLVGGVRHLLLVLFVAVALVLLIACFNVANLLLVRSQARSSEVAIRVALGAGRGRLARQMLVEAGVLGVLGGSAGLALATLGLEGLRVLGPANLPRLDTIHMSIPVFAFAGVATCASVTVFGLVPVFRTRKIDPHRSLTQRTNSVAKEHRQMSRTLVITEVALSFVLLVAAGLLLRTFDELRSARPGFDPTNLITMSITSSGRQETRAEVAQFFRELFPAVSALPGVVDAGSTNRLPLGGGIYGGPWATSEAAMEEGNNPEADIRFISPRYFRAMGTRLVAGRFFQPGDGDDVAIVDERMARLAWPGLNAVGQLLWTGQLGRGGAATRVVGVVEPIRHTGLGDAAKETVYLYDTASSLGPGAQRFVVVRASGDAAEIATSVRAVVRRLDPGATASRVRSMESLVGDALAPTRFAVSLFGIFSAVAMVLAAIGLYGLVAYAVSLRRREMGIRLALGAQRLHILRTIVGEGMMLTAIGLVGGFVGSFFMTNPLRSMLYGVSPTDVATLLSVGLVLVLVGAAASYVPARRALRVDPVITLRTE